MSVADGALSTSPDAGRVDDDTLRFLRALFAPYAASAAARVELRCFRAGRRFPIRKWCPLDDNGLAGAARYARALGSVFDVYYTVLPRRDRIGGADGVRLASWLWADIDGGEDGPEGAAELLLAALHAGRLPRPQSIVHSGGGLHVYWRLAQPVPCRTVAEQDIVRTTLRRLVTTIGGTAPGAYADRASAEPARILRLPGTANHKQETPRPVRLLRLAENADAFSLSWWRTHLPPERIPIPRPPDRDEGDRPRSERRPPPAVAAKLASAPDGQKHNTMRDVAVWARKAGLPEAAIRAYAEQVGRASGVPIDAGNQQRHLEDLVRWTVERVV